MNSMKTVFYWEPEGLTIERANPYGAMLARAMADIGVEVVPGYRTDPWDQDWLVNNQEEVGVLHQNWPHYNYDVGNLAGSVSRCADFVGYLARARSLGYKVVWTVHNFYPHKSTSHELDRLARFALTSLATAIIVHCRYGAELVEKHFYRADGVFQIPHGNFIDVYPNTVTKDEARRRLGLPAGNFIYLYFGNIRPYKGLEALFDAFVHLPDADTTLLFAGKFHADYGEEDAQSLRGTDPRIEVRASPHIPRENLQLYINAADVIVLPFLDVLTSGSAITTLGFGRPVIVPAIGCLPMTPVKRMACCGRCRSPVCATWKRPARPPIGGLSPSPGIESHSKRSKPTSINRNDAYHAT
jgi:glycosyltransferase involved in cell wall biosynthesis